MKQYLVHCRSSLADSSSESVKFVVTADSFESATHLAKEKAAVRDQNLRIDGMLELLNFAEDEMTFSDSKTTLSFAQDVRGRSTKIQPMDV